MSVVETVMPMLNPVVEGLGMELYDLEYVKEGGDRILRLYIDKEGGVDLEDCERVSRAAEALLDARDPIPSAYVLEVSSPGIERKLVKESHFTRYIGHKVMVKLFAPLSSTGNKSDGETGLCEAKLTNEEKRKNFTGVLTAYKNGTIHLTDENNTSFEFEKKQVSVCRLVVF